MSRIKGEDMVSKSPQVPFETWPYEEQTKIKHEVFADYFDKWVKILGKFHKLNYIDCFAGCGAYHDDGKIYYGSPVLAAKIIKTDQKDAVLVIIDKKRKNLKNLEKIFEYEDLKDTKIIPIHQDFDKTINDMLDKKSNLAPTFFFIDPWGFSINYLTLKRIMEIEKSEIFMNFMFNAVNRFLSLPKLEETTTKLFGTDKWKELIHLRGEEREKRIINLYKTQLEKFADYVYYFPMEFPHRKRTYYYLVHLTNHLKGCSIMKSCFASHNLGRTAYRGDRSGQQTLFETEQIRLQSAKEFFLRKYNTASKTFIDILKENISKTDYLESEMSRAFKEGEKDGCLFIDRRPRITEKTDRLRTGIEEKDIIYFSCFPSIIRKTLLYRTKVEYGNFTINHVLGCAHGCNYPCYARMMALKYGQICDYEDWLHPRIVANALELIDKELPKYRAEIDFVHMSFTTHPFMYDMLNKRTYPHIQEMTLKIIEKLNNEGIKCTVLTKGLYPKILTIDGKFNRDNEYGITLVSLDSHFKKEFEPYSPDFEDRIAALKFLHDKGLKTWVSIEPYPTPNIVEQNIEDLLGKISFVDKIIFGKMNYNVSSNKFDSNWEYYKECAQKLIRFCKEKNIRYHIKQGTPLSREHTKKIFNGNSFYANHER